MQTPEELVKKITQEEQSLDAKLHNLEYFMMSEDFIKVSKEQKTLLEQQHKVMTEYKLILIKRAHRINWEAGRDSTREVIEKIREHINNSKVPKAAENPKEEQKDREDVRLEPHVFSAMEYEAWKKKQEAETEEPSKEFCSDCPYYNKAKNECTNRNRKDGKCWIVSDPTAEKYPEFPRCPFKDGNTMPKCINLRGDKCSFPDTLCYKSARIPKKEEEDGTPSDK